MGHSLEKIIKRNTQIQAISCLELTFYFLFSALQVDYKQSDANNHHIRVKSFRSIPCSYQTSDWGKSWNLCDFGGGEVSTFYTESV